MDKKVVGGTLLVAGITIGAGMLALPIVTGACGFLGSLLIFTCCWLLMLWTAHLVLEICLSFPDKSNLISMAQQTLGPVGAAITWVLSLCLLYALLAAYLAGGGLILTTALSALQFSLPLWVGVLLFLVLFGAWTLLGLSWVDKANAALMVLMLLSYLFLCYLLIDKINFAQVAYFSTDNMLVALSIVITAFAFHVFIPSLCTYLDRDVKKIKLCLFIGSLIPYLIYIIWELIILGTVPIGGENGILHAAANDINLAALLKSHVEGYQLSVAIELFSLAAIVTSFLGISQSLLDFLKDGLKIKSRTFGSRLMLYSLAILPSLLFALFARRGFLLALEYAGVFVTALVGILPILMLGRLRIAQVKTLYKAPFSPLSAVLALTLFSLLIAVVLLHNVGFF